MSFANFSEMKRRVSIQAACSFLQLDVTPFGDQLRGPCPVCRAGGEQCLVVTPGSNAAYCSYVRRGGDVIWLVSHTRGVDVEGATQLLNAAFNIKQ